MEQRAVIESQVRVRAKKKRRLNRRKLTINSVLTVLGILTIYTLATIVPAHFKVIEAMNEFMGNLKIMFLSPNVGNDTFSKLLSALGQSIYLAGLTTIAGAFGGFVMALLSANNLAPRWLSQIMKSLMASIRAIPTILWVLIYSVSLGLGADAAVIGLTFHSVAYLAKVFANSIEELPQDTIEALKVGGIGILPIIAQAVIPTVKSRLLSWTFIRFEINFANAVVVGAAAGAGGIGYQLYMASSFYFDFHEVGMIIYLILAFTFGLELVSRRLRAKFIEA